LVPGEFTFGVDDYEQDRTLSGRQLRRHVLSFFQHRFEFLQPVSMAPRAHGR
jgi:hypothetical protein